MAEEYDEEYEIIPTSPIRRLEKRISKVEASSSSSEIRKLIEQIIELIKSNQRVIDDIIKSNSDLRNEISKLPGKIDQLISNIHEFIELLKASATEEAATGGAGLSSEAFEPLVKKMDELIEQNKQSVEASQAVISGLDTIDKRLKRLYLQYRGS
jgi:methyl-accepting chemotaxis protein